MRKVNLAYVLYNLYILIWYNSYVQIAGHIDVMYA